MFTAQMASYQPRKVLSEYERTKEKLKTDQRLISIGEKIRQLIIENKTEILGADYRARIGTELQKECRPCTREYYWLQSYSNFMTGTNISVEFKKTGYETFKIKIKNLDTGEIIKEWKFKDNEKGKQGLKSEFKAYRYSYLEGKDNICVCFVDSEINVRSYKFNWYLLKPKGAV